MKPVRVEVLTPMLAAVGYECKACSLMLDQVQLRDSYRKSCGDEYPDEHKREVAKLTDCLERLASLYKHRVQFVVFDTLSPWGLWKHLRHRVGQTPAFIVDGKHVCAGWDLEKLESCIDLRIREEVENMERKSLRGAPA